MKYVLLIILSGEPISIPMETMELCEQNRIAVSESELHNFRTDRYVSERTVCLQVKE